MKPFDDIRSLANLGPQEQSCDRQQATQVGQGLGIDKITPGRPGLFS